VKQLLKGFQAQFWFSFASAVISAFLGLTLRLGKRGTLDEIRQNQLASGAVTIGQASTSSPSHQPWTLPKIDFVSRLDFESIFERRFMSEGVDDMQQPASAHLDVSTGVTWWTMTNDGIYAP